MLDLINDYLSVSADTLIYRHANFEQSNTPE